ncbi:MAG TPA: glycoside hydrolase domain-containing protein [Streptosporangiaceae bacterium]|nr:glycoside hydrolase domain-containing protein [Streptosporangiaceae bacterium]
MSFRRYLSPLIGLAILLAVGWPAPAPAAPVRQWRTVSFGGVSLRVPASWPVINFGTDPSACPRLDIHAVYLGAPGPAPHCPPGLVGRTDAVLIGPAGRAGLGTGPASEPRRVAGRTGAQVMLANRDWALTRLLTEVLPGAGVEVAISYRTDPALALTIRSSIKVTAGVRAAARHAGPVTPDAGPVTRRAGSAGRARLTGPGRGPARLARPLGIYAGAGFDTCAAPGATAMTRWLGSPYRAVGVYIGGANRACAQANLTPAWLTGIARQGWRYFPIYPGLQSSCVLAAGDATITTSQARAQGTAAADDAAAQAASLRIGTGTPLSYDMEAYRPACDWQVTTFLSAWDSELRARGYASGVYESFTNIGALVRAAGRITEPDVIYYADWDGQAITRSGYLPHSLWTAHQRLHQYRGGHLETYGGLTLDIDSDQLDVNLGGRPAPASYGAFRITVGVNANGTAEWFARAAADTLTHSWQRPVGSLTWSAVHAVGDSPASIASNPSATRQADGTLALFARDSTGAIVHGWQQAGFPNDWEWGNRLPVPRSQARPGTDPASALLPGGDVEVYQTAVTGSVFTIRQRGPGGKAAWTRWGSIKGHCASSPVPVADSGHGIDIFCVTTSGTAAADRWDGHAWSRWHLLTGSPADLAGVPSVVVDGAGRTEFFAATRGGGLVHAWQQGAGGGWTWGVPLAGVGPAAPLGGGIRISGSPAAATWPAGQVVVFATLAGGRVGYIRQADPAVPGSWTSWASIGGIPGGKVLGSPAGWLNTSGAAGIAVLDGNLRLATASHPASGDPNSDWSAWSEVGGGF